MPWSDSLPQFSLAGTLLTVLLLFFAAFGEPFLGRKAFAWLSRRRDRDALALVRVHAATMGVHVLWGVLFLAVLLLSPGLDAADLGLRLPDSLGPVVGGALGGLIALGGLWLFLNGLPARVRSALPAKGRRSRRRRAPAPARNLPEPERDRWLLVPWTRNERLAAAGAAVTGGVFTEMVYRGLFIVLVASMGVPLWIAGVLSVALFSVAYLYQGWWGLVSAGASGTLFTVLYLGTGSLWVPIAVHVALNLRSIAFPPASLREGPYEDDHEDPYESEYEDRSDGEGPGGGAGEAPQAPAATAQSAVPTAPAPQAPAATAQFAAPVAPGPQAPRHGGPRPQGGTPPQGMPPQDARPPGTPPYGTPSPGTPGYGSPRQGTPPRGTPPWGAPPPGAPPRDAGRSGDLLGEWPQRPQGPGA
ncbi:CPBP family intramembrane glutamic endopeptidase [Nocardiopsis algeriensis]|uniref:Membrane protease YdiL (CAAX protease family) n=1 Tax=Nocardiopsis algeriensis TaxID=1478215 RepID=A0A841INV8_9ACTN|nr:membrane protease YdiL (CAAX protease family) [Nocardiopsis algeriensis]